MPLYEYHCQDCENRFERIEKVSEIHDVACPACGGVAHRLLGAPALKFKGSGWYVNDYGKGNGDRPTSSEEKSKHEATSTHSETDTPASSKPAAPAKDTSAKDTKVA